MKRMRHATALAAFAGFFVFLIILVKASETSTLAATLGAHDDAQVDPGAATFNKRCSICHGELEEGNLPAFPPLAGVKHKYTDQQITEIIRKGKGRMPGFAKLQDTDIANLLHYLAGSGGATASAATHDEGQVKAGKELFQQNCAFCHGRDTLGGETGPDLSQSKLVIADVNGDKISEVVLQGRPEKKMPAFNFSVQEIQSLAAFIHSQKALADSKKGGRRGVEVADLQTGNVEAGKAYFNGAGTCSKCHSAAGDLSGVASRYQGLKLEERMLYPSDVKSKVTVTLPGGQKISGILAYLDEFTVGLRDSTGAYHSWQTSRVKYLVDSPVDAHVELFPKYTDDDIHNLMAYLQTLR